MNVLEVLYAVWQSFLSIFPHLSGGTMATSQACCHLPHKMLNSAAKCADRARIYIMYSLGAVAGGNWMGFTMV
jgi:hypothetical protein